MAPAPPREVHRDRAGPPSRPARWPWRSSRARRRWRRRRRRPRWCIRRCSRWSRSDCSSRRRSHRRRCSAARRPSTRATCTKRPRDWFRRSSRRGISHRDPESRSGVQSGRCARCLTTVDGPVAAHRDAACRRRRDGGHAGYHRSARVADRHVLEAHVPEADVLDPRRIQRARAVHRVACVPRLGSFARVDEVRGRIDCVEPGTAAVCGAFHPGDPPAPQQHPQPRHGRHPCHRVGPDRHSAGLGNREQTLLSWRHEISGCPSQAPCLTLTRWITPCAGVRSGQGPNIIPVVAPIVVTRGSIGRLLSRSWSSRCYARVESGAMNDRMFHVLVLGGMALVGCGGSTLAEPDEAQAPATQIPTVPRTRHRRTSRFPSKRTRRCSTEWTLSTRVPLWTQGPCRDVWFPNEAPPPPPPLPVDAQAGDAGASDANGFADAVVAEGGPCMPWRRPSERGTHAGRARPIAWGAIEEDARCFPAVSGGAGKPVARAHAPGASCRGGVRPSDARARGARMRGPVLGLVARAASDEVRHAETCRRMAVATMGTQGCHGPGVASRGFPGTS